MKKVIDVDDQYLQKLQEIQNELSFLSGRMKIEKVEKLVANLRNRTEYLIRIRNLKQALNNRLVLKRVHIVIKFNQNAWLKLCINMNTDLRKKAKKWFWKRFS